ncbi:hypothetical protein SAMN04489731_11227 [Amycolatopsis regifaucium]|nr:hypothetical protein SAMN04489731_11227 [Amycolatopsis regifaucium]
MSRAFKPLDKVAASVAGVSGSETLSTQESV